MDIADTLLPILRTEAVKMQLQLAALSTERRQDTVLGTLIYDEIDTKVFMDRVKVGINQVAAVRTVDELRTLLHDWNVQRGAIQYAGYGWGKEHATNKGSAYALVFLHRTVKRTPAITTLLRR